MATTIRFTTYDSEDLAVEVVANYSPGDRSPTWDRGIGVWLPPDPEEIEIVSVTAKDPGANVGEVEADVEGLEEAVRLLADDDAEDYRYDTREEAAGDR